MARFGTLSRAEAEALARRWKEGDIISEVERWQRLQSWIRDQVGEEIDRQSFGTLREVKGYMKEKGLTTYTADVDQNLLDHTICEELCVKQLAEKNLTGPDLDHAYWTCMHQCSPVKDPMTLDQSSPLFPASPVEPEKLGQRIVDYRGRHKR